jgi:hypothetical protein
VTVLVLIRDYVDDDSVILAVDLRLAMVNVRLMMKVTVE